jgi:hypothetical protein
VSKSIDELKMMSKALNMKQKLKQISEMANQEENTMVERKRKMHE